MEASPHVRETPEESLEKGQGLQYGRAGWRTKSPPEDGQSEGRRLRAQRVYGKQPDATRKSERQPVNPPVNLRTELLLSGDLGPPRGQPQLCGLPSRKLFCVINET